MEKKEKSKYLLDLEKTLRKLNKTKKEVDLETKKLKELNFKHAYVSIGNLEEVINEWKERINKILKNPIYNNIIKEIEDKSIAKNKYTKIISIKLFKEICSKHQLGLRIILKEDDISFIIENYEDIYFYPWFDIDSILENEIWTDTLFIPCERFKEIIQNEGSFSPNIITHADEFSISEIAGKEYYRIWRD